MKWIWRYGWIAIAVALGAIAISVFGWDKVPVLFNRTALTDFFEMAGPGSVWLFLGAHVIANAVGVPGTLLVVVGGAVYGLWWGTVWSVIGATLGAIAAFWLARYLLHGWFQQRFAHKPFFKALNKTLCTNGLACVLTIRFSPVSPFNVVNFALGLTPIPVRYYALGTLIGIIPGTLAYTWLGVTGSQALSGGSLVPLVSCLMLLMLLSALPLVIRHRSISP
ncbi:MAG: TVP38/TMEM64 family protein [Cyanobacteria bacterium J06621_11]